MSDLEDRLRADLNRRAERAPDGAPLAERILTTVRTEPRPAGRRGWPTWTLPLLAACAVAAIVAGVLVGVAQLRDSDGNPVAGGSDPVVPTQSHSAPASPTFAPSTSPQAPTTGRSFASSSNTSKPTSVVPDNPVGLTNFTATDLTFYGAKEGWALGSADCLVTTGTCPAMVRTTDGGAHWRSLVQPPGGVTGIRFATDQLGYAYSADVLEMTTNGGKTWTQQSGGAAALETFSGNVIRVQASRPGSCPPGCDYEVSTAKVGSNTWAAAKLPGGAVGDGIDLVRSSDDAYLLVTGHTSGGAGSAYSTLFVSTDDGGSWSRQDDPCRGKSGTETDAVAIAAAPGGVTAMCQTREDGSGDDFAVVSAGGTSRFALPKGTLSQHAVNDGLLAGDPKSVLVAAGDKGAYRSTDAGGSWTPIKQIPGGISFVGFESPRLGRIVSDKGTVVWTTTDGGGSWHAFRFPTS